MDYLSLQPSKKWMDIVFSYMLLANFMNFQRICTGAQNKKLTKLVRKGAQKSGRSPHQIYALSLFRFRIACAHLRLRTPTPTHASAYARLRLRTLRPTDPLPRGRVPRPGPSARDSRLARSEGVYLPPKF